MSVPIASRLGLGSVLVYLLAGIVISLLLILFNVDINSLERRAELDSVLMLFLVGQELKLNKLQALRSKLFGLRGRQAALTVVFIMGLDRKLN